MVKLNEYKNIHLNDVYLINESRIIIKDIFILNDKIYVSYNGNETLLTELINDFLIKDKMYVENITTINNTCSCGCNG